MHPSALIIPIWITLFVVFSINLKRCLGRGISRQQSEYLIIWPIPLKLQYIRRIGRLDCGDVPNEQEETTEVFIIIIITIQKVQIYVLYSCIKKKIFCIFFLFQKFCIIGQRNSNQDIFSLQFDIKAMLLNQYNASTSVYLEQITNHIQIGGGYSQLRKHLFKELHQLNSGEAVSDDRLSDAIVSQLAEALNRTVKFHRSAQTFRIIQIIEDLLTYAEEIMTPSMHTEQFVSALMYTANPKIVTFDANTDADIRKHALGIFLFWFQRYGREEQDKYELFIKAFKELKDKKLLFPNEIMIKPNDFFKKELEIEKNAPLPAQTNESKTSRIILDDIQAFTIKTQNLFKQNFKAIATTEYVRLIKHKSKVLFQFTSKPNDFQAKQKNLVKDLYKRLRVILKELDKFKETSLQSKKSQQTQKQYVEAKFTPKKEASAIESSLKQKVKETPLKNIQARNVPKPTDNMDLLDIGPVIQIPSPQKNVSQKIISPSKPQQVQNFDLLNDDPKVKQNAEEQEQQFVQGIIVTSTEQKKVTEQESLFQVFSTPKKQEHEEDSTLIAKNNSSNSQDPSLQFDNQKMAKNPYSLIPDNLNLTPTSSIQDEEQSVQENPIFSLFGLLNMGKSQNTSPESLQQQIIHYDFIHKKGKNNSQQTPNKVEVTVKQQPLKEAVIKDIVNSPTYKNVTPVNYEIYANFISDSPQKYDEQSKFQLTTKKNDNKQLQEAQFDNPKSVGKIKQYDQ